MGINYCHLSRAERLIAAGRVAITVFSLFAAYLLPIEPARHDLIINSFPIGYLVYATVLAAALWCLFNTYIHSVVVVHYHRDKSFFKNAM